MSEKSKVEFVLELVKIFLWPSIIIVAAIWFGPDLKDILKNRTWKIGVVEVGDRISGLQQSVQYSMQTQKGYLQKIQKNASNPTLVTELTGSAIQEIDNAQNGVKQDIQTIKEAIPQKEVGLGERESKEGGKTVEKTNPTSAREWELTGFGKIMDKDINGAIAAFTEAEKNWPNYHNVAEIRKALIMDQQSLTSATSQKWEDLYRQLLTKLSWGMPQKIRNEMISEIGRI